MVIKPLPTSIKKGIDKCPLIVGVGPSAWPRIITSYYFPKFKTICLNDSQDDEYIRGMGVDVFSLRKKKPKIEVSPQTPGRILNTNLVKEYVKGLGEPFSFLVYKSSTFLEKVCAENRWNFIGNKKDQREIYENKRVFKEILREIGVEAIPGENLLIDDLTDERFIQYQEKLGQKNLVLQLAEMTYGGGSGTFFVDDVSQLKEFRERVAQIRVNFEGKKKKIETVNVAPFIIGTSSSISCCATFKGTLSGPIQTQIIDVYQVAAKEPGRSGKYAGTDWSYRKYGTSSQKQADFIAQKFGEYLYKHGYKGIFGIDLIVEESGKVWPVECNPRDTDAFPVVSMLMMDAGCIPLDVFHNLELLNIEYDFDFEEVNNSYKLKPFEASQIIIENRLNSSCYVRGFVKAGVYSLKDDSLKFVREGFSLFDIKNEDEVLVTEGVPKEFGDRGYPISGRIFRLIKRGKILQKDGILTEEMSKFVEAVYSQLNLIEVPSGVIEKRGLKSLYINRPSLFSDYLEDKSISIVNIVGKSSHKASRPFKIAWRKFLDPSVDTISQITSKRARKQIKTDEKKIKELGIEVNIIEEIDDNIFENWLLLYKKIIGSMENGEVLVTNDWLNKKKNKEKKVGGVFAYRNNEMIGGELFFENNKRLGIGYGVAEKLNELSGGLTLLMDYKFLDFAKNKGYREVSFGQDTNFYGYDLSKGLVSYKQKLGFSPVPANKTFWLTTYILDFKKFESGIYYFVNINGKLELADFFEEETGLLEDILSQLEQGIQK